ncbi:MAG: hypothetical protein FWD69_09745 [Polyangiaceae bacterium]|nr:hypothetical protein [Polyangiaceae bacterium]
MAKFVFAATAVATAVVVVPFTVLAEEERPPAEEPPHEAAPATENAHAPATENTAPDHAKGPESNLGESSHHGEEASHHAEAKEGEEKKEEAEEKEPDWEVTGDFVGGATTLDVLRESKTPGERGFDSMRVSAYSLVVGVERRLGERWKVGASIPFITAYLSSRTGESEGRSAQLIGNLELEAAYIFARGEHWELEGSLGVALPTAGGKEQPSAEEFSAEPEGEFKFRSIDRFAAARAASFTRGLYSSSLFESGRLGLVPRVAAVFRFDKLTVSPMVKVENLIDTTGDASEKYVGEITGGVRAAYKVVPYFEPGLHAFINARFTSPAEFDALVLEPNVRFPVGPIIPQVSVLIPVAGDLVDDKTFGVRVAIVGEF